MKNRLTYLFICILAHLHICTFAQVTNKIQADSVRIYQVGGHPAELIIENSTRNNTNGFLQNWNNGRTRFSFALDSAWKTGNSLYFRRGTSNLSFTFRDGIDSINISNDSVYSYKDGIATFKGLVAGSAVDEKLNNSDTTSMLSPYLRKIDTSGRWLSKVSASITGALNVSGSPIQPPNGNLNFTWTGTSPQYVKGNGTLGTLSTDVQAIGDTRYSFFGHTHLAADVLDLTPVVRNMFDGDSNINVNHTTGKITFTGITGGGSADGNNYVNSANFSNNTLTFGRVGLTPLTASWDSSIYHSKLYYDGIYQPSGSYLTANQSISFAPTGDVTGSTTGTISLAPSLTIGNNKVTDAMLRQSAALSILGRSANSPGNVADITAPSDGDVLRRSGTSLGFGSIPQSSVTNLTTDLAGKINDADTTNKWVGIVYSRKDSLFYKTGTTEHFIRKESFVNVLDYGAIGDGTTNDYTAFSNATAAASAGNKRLYIPGGYTFIVNAGTTNGLSLPQGLVVFGDGISSRVKTTNNGVLFFLNDYVDISYLHLLGTGVASGKPLQTLIFSYQHEGSSIHNCYLDSCAGDGSDLDYGGAVTVNATNVSPFFGGIKVYDNYIMHSGVGIYAARRGEYSTFTLNHVMYNTIGILLLAGNSVVSECHVDYNETNLKIDSSANSGHGIISSSTFNHATTNALVITGIVEGQVFTNCKFYYGNTSITNSKGIVFIGSDWSSGGIAYTITLTNNSNVAIVNSRWPKSPTSGYITVNVVSGEGFIELNNFDF